MSNEELRDDDCMDTKFKETLTNVIKGDEQNNAVKSSQKKINTERTSSAIDSNKTDIRENLVNWHYIYTYIQTHIKGVQSNPDALRP